MSTVEEVFGPVIYSYSREQAIRDGVLVDVSSMAKEAGVVFPVAVTQRVWSEYIVPDDRARKWGQSEEGRLWDTLHMFRMAIMFSRRGSVIHRKDLLALQERTLYYSLYFVMKERQKRRIKLKAVCGPGDDGEPVITIICPDED